MIVANPLTEIERSQLDRKELARGAWREGRIDNARLILGSVTREAMTPRVAGEVYVTEASLLCAEKKFFEALDVLKTATLYIDECDARVQGSFYFHRALCYRNLGDDDGALTDYAGSIIYWQTADDSDYEIATRINLAELYLMRDDLQQAREQIDQAFALLSPASTHYCNAHDTKAKVLLAQGDLRGAVMHARIAVNAAGENEIWKADALLTLGTIKTNIIDAATCALTVKDLQGLKRRIIEHALDATGGSIVEAAKLLETSHQAVAYTADKKGLARAAPRIRRKSIIKTSS